MSDESNADAPSVKTSEAALRAGEKPSDIVGHKTMMDGSHAPLFRAEAEALMAAIDARDARRAELMPDTRAALKMLFEAYDRLRQLGWREAEYCPKDGSAFEVIETGSTGIFDCRYDGEWPNGHYLVAAHGDIWPSCPILFRLYPEDQARHDAKIAAMREAYRNQPRGLSAGAAPEVKTSEAALRAQEHEIKCWPEFFRYLWSGEKTFELRLDDRGYAAGDTLLQREWTKRGGYTGRWIRFDVPFVLSGTWLARNHVCMSLKELERYEPRGLSAGAAPEEQAVNASKDTP